MSMRKQWQRVVLGAAMGGAAGHGAGLILRYAPRWVTLLLIGFVAGLATYFLIWLIRSYRAFARREQELEAILQHLARSANAGKN